jgi:hypothetical protein
MARKKRVGLTTYARYTYKAIRLHGGKPSDQLIEQLGHTQASAWQAGFANYQDAYSLILPILQDHKVPSALYGIYRAFAFEVENKVRQKKVVTSDELIQQWIRKGGLDPAVMRDIIEALHPTIEAPTTRPAPSASKKGG